LVSYKKYENSVPLFQVHERFKSKRLMQHVKSKCSRRNVFSARTHCRDEWD